MAKNYPSPNIPEILFCRRCKNHKSREDFRYDKNGQRASPRWCIQCRKAYNVAWSDKNRARANELARNWRKANREVVNARIRSRRQVVGDEIRKKAVQYFLTPKGTAIRLQNGAVERAKAKGIEYSLTLEWLQQRIDAGICEATGISFSQGKTKGPFRPSVDRINPELGYTTDNCRVVTMIYNIAKRNWTDEVVLTMAQALVAKRAKR